MQVNIVLCVHAFTPYRNLIPATNHPILERLIWYALIVQLLRVSLIVRPKNITNIGNEMCTKLRDSDIGDIIQKPWGKG